jgi:hypothetical protein
LGGYMRQSGELMVGQPSFGPIIEKSGYNDVSRTSTDIHGAVVWCSDRKKRQRAMKHGQSSIEGYDAYTRQIEVLTHISTFRRQIESNYSVSRGRRASLVTRSEACSACLRCEERPAEATVAAGSTYRVHKTFLKKEADRKC